MMAVSNFFAFSFSLPYSLLVYLHWAQTLVLLAVYFMRSAKLAPCHQKYSYIGPYNVSSSFQRAFIFLYLRYKCYILLEFCKKLQKVFLLYNDGSETKRTE